MERIPQSVTIRIPLKAYLSSDHVSIATGKTIAVVISKNGAAFGNPSGGATNATEIANGWYYVDLSTTDTGTLGPLIVRGTASGVDDVEPPPFEVVKAHNAGFDGVPDATAGATNGLPLAVDSSGRVDVLKINGTSQTARDLGASVLLSSGTGTGQISLSSGTVTLTAGQLTVKKNTALASFEFLMIDSSDHISPKTGLTVTAQRSIDGGAFASCANSVTEISNGIYKISLASTDLNGNVITLMFAASGADTTYDRILTQP